MPFLQVSHPSTIPMIGYAANLKRCIEVIRFMAVEVDVIEMITSEIIPKMSFEEHTRLNKDLEYINELSKEDSEYALDLSKNFEDHFVDDCLFIAMVDGTERRVESYDSSVDPETDDNTDDELSGSKSDRSSIASSSSNMHMEDVAKATSSIDLTDADKTEDCEKINDKQSSSVQVVPNLTIYKNLTNLLKDLDGLNLCPIT